MIDQYAFASSYRSGADDLGGDLFVKALELSHTYHRAAGFFSSSVLDVLAPGLAGFFSRGGSMVLVTSPKFSRADVLAIEHFYVARSPRHSALDYHALFAQLRARKIPSAEVFGELLRRGALSMFVARPTDALAPAIYHEKFAVFSDDTAALAISGSGNESALALRGSFERFEVFRSWADSERNAVFRFQTQFRALVANNTDGLEVAPLVFAYQNAWLAIRSGPPTDEVQQDTPMVVRADAPEILVPFPGKLFSHQEVAIERWAEADGRGLLAMATGSGKTITALSLAARLHDALGDKPLCLLIVAPFIHLVDQWIGVGRRFGLDPIRCAEGEGRWRDALSTAIFAVNAGQRSVLSIAVTSATLQTPSFQSLLGRIRATMLVIGDEAHNYGTAKIAAALPQKAVFRLGLSATPERWLDDDGTARVRSYFGKVVHEYDLARALSDGVLTPYQYTPVLTELEPDEAAEYENITAKLARFGISDFSDDLTDGAKALLMKRARLLASARAKMPLLMRLLEPRRLDSHILIYCGDGSVEGEPDDMPIKQIDAAVKMATSMGMVCAKYTAETPPEIRKQILTDFDAGRIQVLVAIRCLDEGVDVPSTRTAFILSSSTNPRQFIQRRGRVLRRSPETGKVKAEIFDFFVIPAVDQEEGLSKSMRSVVQKQLQRVMEFSSLAMNGATARAELLAWTKRHGLMGVWADEQR